MGSGLGLGLGLAAAAAAIMTWARAEVARARRDRWMGAVAWFRFISFFVFPGRHVVRRVSALFFSSFPHLLPPPSPPHQDVSAFLHTEEFCGCCYKAERGGVGGAVKSVHSWAI